MTPDIILIIGVALVVAVIVIFLAFFFIVCLLEKHHVNQMVPCDSSQLTTASFYCSAVTQQATVLGFRELGTFAQSRNSKVYMGVVSLWLSPDGLTLLRIMGGKTARMPIKRTNLVSWAPNGKRLVTADSHTVNDLSGLTDEEVVMRAHLPELYERHRQRLAATAFEAQIIPDRNILEVCDARDRARVSRLNEMGYARLLNPEGTIWRFTLKAAWQICFVNLYKQMRDATQRQEERRRMKRPGHA